MAKRPVIGLTGGRISGGDIVDNLDVLADVAVDVFYADYSRAIIRAGGMPLFLPLDIDPVEAVELLDGLLLTGGADIEPARYGASVDARTQTPEIERDAHETAVLDCAIARRLPTIGICRGLQLVNVHQGGTLVQHVGSHARLDTPATELHHEVRFAPESVLGGIYGDRRRVNSLHHQAISRLGRDLRVTARSEDGGIEGIEHHVLPIVAVQWHPEMLATAATDPLFAWLVSTAVE